MIRLIAAIDRRNGIAKQGGMPWNIPEDEQYFTDQTKSRGGRVLTGGATFRLAYLNQPLADRDNYILTRDPTPLTGATVVNDLPAFLAAQHDQELWVSGGAQVFEQLLALGYGDELYMTKIEADFGCDQFFPPYETDFQLIEQSDLREQNGFIFRYATYRRAT